MKLKGFELCIKLQPIPVFLDIAKFSYFCCKYANAKRTQGVCQLIHIFLRSSLGKVKMKQDWSLYDMCDRF